jgi:hypothetical protein
MFTSLKKGKLYKSTTQSNGEQQLQNAKGSEFHYSLITPFRKNKQFNGRLGVANQTVQIGVKDTDIQVDDIVVIENPFNTLKTMKGRVQLVEPRMDSLNPNSVYLYCDIITLASQS